MMKRSLFSALALAALAVVDVAFVPPASAQPPPRPAQGRPQARQVKGQIVRMDKDQFVVKTRGDERLTFHVRPKTKFLLKDKAVQFNDLRVGANVVVTPIPEDERQFAETVVVEEAAVPADETLVEGEIVRVIGEDQVVVRTPERKEVIVFVDPQTKFLIEEKAGKFKDLRPGLNVRANVRVHDGRHMAREFTVPRRRK